jgi:hypothetical protein
MSPAEFIDADLSGAIFRNVDLSEARMSGTLLINAEISGPIEGLRINGIEVAPLVAAELDRRHPELIMQRSSDIAELRQAWSLLRARWAELIARAGELDEQLRRASVGGEWSVSQTLRHLVFVINSWFDRTITNAPRPYWPPGLPPSFVRDSASYGINPVADPSWEQITEAVQDALERVQHGLVALDDVSGSCRPNPAPGFPPDTDRPVLGCLHILLDEAWAHHQYAIRDLHALGVPWARG